MDVFKEMFKIKEKISGKEYRVFCNDEVLNYEGQFAMTVVTDTGEEIIIATTEICEAYKRNQKLAYVILFHELGHIYYGHNHTTSNTKQERLESINSNIPYYKEVQADNYVVHFLGEKQVVDALKMLCKVFKEDSLEYKDIQLRIKKIEETNWSLML